LRCLLLIEHEQELCVCELMRAIDEIQPKVSRHLAQLRRCNLLVDRRQGKWVFYRINPDLADWAKTVLTRTLESNRCLVKNITRPTNGRSPRALGLFEQGELSLCLLECVAAMEFLDAHQQGLTALAGWVDHARLGTVTCKFPGNDPRAMPPHWPTA
jgi:ArsR family transcriptional regulator